MTALRKAGDFPNKAVVEYATVQVEIPHRLIPVNLRIKCERAGEEDVERGDVHAQIDRLGGLTDLADPEGLPVSETTAARLRQLNEVVMGMVRSRLSNIQEKRLLANPASENKEH